jgi:serine acetyltransferase
MDKITRQDLLRIGLSDKNPKTVFIKKLLDAYSFHVIYFFRLHKKLCEKPSKSLFCTPVLLLKKLFEKFYDIHISPNAEISGGLYIGHFGGIFIGYCSIGENCNINHQVSIGSFAEKIEIENEKVIIGDKVWIGAHTTILPGVTIGDSVTISAGTTVDRDIPSHCLVAGKKCRTINNNFDNSSLLQLDTDAEE